MGRKIRITIPSFDLPPLPFGAAGAAPWPDWMDQWLEDMLVEGTKDDPVGRELLEEVGAIPPQPIIVEVDDDRVNRSD